MSSRTVAILYPGDMGSGLGRLLRKHSVRVVTNLEGRSPRSQQLALTAGFEDLGSDRALLTTADTLISVLSLRRLWLSPKELPRVQKQWNTASCVLNFTSMRMPCHHIRQGK